MITDDLIQDREDFKRAVERRREFRKKATICYKFYYGEQWEEETKKKLNEQGRPAITINRVRPLVNLLSGYQRLNRYEPDFLPRTANDLEICKIRKGVNKQIFDANDFDAVEARVGMDASISGEGWAQVEYEPDYETLDGEARIKRRSPFDMYPDPESKEPDLSDAEFHFDAFWITKDKAKLTYPEHAEDIDAYITYYDHDEEPESIMTEPLYYSRETKKVRLITKYYKKWINKTVETAEYDPVTFKPKKISLPTYEIWFATFIGSVELERRKYPYEHNMFPYCRCLGYYIGEGDTPDGVVYDLLDPQREVNKGRSQILHNINTMANSNYLANRAAVTPEQEKKLAKYGSKPGAVNIVNDINAIKRNDPPPFNQGLVQYQQMTSEDFKQISNVNEAAMGTEIPSGSSGKAIELKQKQAVTGITILFDNLRLWKKEILYRLWGKKKKRGIVPQYYTEPKIIRITQDDGQYEFIPLNQQVPVIDPATGQPMIDPATGLIQTAIYDISAGEYDVVISDTPATATQRKANYFEFLELMKLMPPNLAPYFIDILVNLSDNPEKETIKQRVNELKQMLMPQMIGGVQQPQPGSNLTQPALQSMMNNGTPTI